MANLLIIAPVDRIAEETARLLRDDALRERLSRNGRALVEAQYSWERTADSYERLYAEVCQPHPPAPSQRREGEPWQSQFDRHVIVPSGRLNA